MDLISSVLSALLFAAFVPGVLLKIPKNGSPATILVVHAVLFAVVTTLVMRFYWHNIKGVVENYAQFNYGKTCPNGYAVKINQAGIPDCLPTGHKTYPTDAGFSSSK